MKKIFALIGISLLFLITVGTSQVLKAQSVDIASIRTYSLLNLNTERITEQKMGRLERLLNKADDFKEAGRFEEALKELTKAIFPHNFNFGRFRITDSQTGIFIESFGEGIDERKYIETLWSKLGFSFNQFYTPKKDLRNSQTRIDSITDPNMTLITTNADVTSGNSQSFNVNIFSNEMFTAQCPAVQNAADKAVDLTVPSITTATSSAIITADNLPTKTKRPYFIVRSSLLGQPTFQGGANSGQLYPVIAIVNKINGYSDFFSLEQNQILYTITKDMTITSITTSIHDPDQTLAEVDDNTSVIYKVRRNRNQPNLIENILSSQKK